MFTPNRNCSLFIESDKLARTSLSTIAAATFLPLIFNLLEFHKKRWFGETSKIHRIVSSIFPFNFPLLMCVLYRLMPPYKTKFYDQTSKKLGASSYDNEIITLHKGGHIFPFTHKKSIPKAMKMKRQLFGMIYWRRLERAIKKTTKSPIKIKPKITENLCLTKYPPN